MKRNIIINKLLRTNKNAFRCLHDLFGLDFMAPYGIIYISGKYTVNKIMKEAEKCGYARQTKLIVLTLDNAKKRYNDGFNLVTIDNSGKIDIDFKIPYYGGSFNSSLDHFYTKYSFDEVRKSDKAEAIIIWQDQQYIKKPLEKPLDFNNRFKLIDIDYAYTSDRKTRYVYRLRLRKNDEKGTKFDYELGRYCSMQRRTNIEDVIDKSGYLVENRRNEWIRKAAALRAEREKSAFVASDNSDKVSDLARRIGIHKAKIIKSLETAETSEELAVICGLLSRYSGLTGIVADFEHFKKNVDNKSFSSIAACEREYNNILNKLNNNKEEKQ